MYTSKNISVVYIAKYSKVKTAFLAIFRTKSGNPAVLASFSYILGNLESLFDFFDFPHHHPGPGTPPPIGGAQGSS
jgi:hypothetical protein